MKQITVEDFKANFSSVLEQVMHGEDVQILYGHSKKPVACLTKIQEKEKKKKRSIGLYNHLGPIWEDENFEMTPEWLFEDMDDLM